MAYCANDTELFDFSNNVTLRFIDSLQSFQRWYAPVHGYICVVICIFGIVTNLVHILVLTRPSMRSLAINCVLTAVAVCDMGTMASYLVYIVHFVLSKKLTCSPTYTYGWIQFLVWHVVFSIALHTTSLWLVVMMAFLRKMTLRVARLNSKWQRSDYAWRLCIAVYLTVFIICIPTLLVHDIVEYRGSRWRPSEHCAQFLAPNFSATIYTIKVPDIAVDNRCRLFKLNLWITGIFFKVIPCILLLLLSIGLMSKLREAERNRRHLMTNKPRKRSQSTQANDRTTVIMLLILLVFLVTELPQGMLVILNAIYTNDVHQYIYFNLGDLLDLLSLVNSSVNFILCFELPTRVIDEQSSTRPYATRTSKMDIRTEISTAHPRTISKRSLLNFLQRKTDRSTCRQFNKNESELGQINNCRHPFKSVGQHEDVLL